MPHVTICTRPFCPCGARARRLLDDRGIDFREIDVGADAAPPDGASPLPVVLRGELTTDGERSP